MLIDKIKLALRIDDNSLDEDIQDTIDAAIADLRLCGILESKIVETDPLILRAIKTFCKAEFSVDEKEAERYRESYDMIRNHLALSMDYTVEAIAL
ncbi:MAG TPA: DNA-packaging protein [Clostridiaceae bacterium]|nr:DNA-packaging protein [Clostridiaceae bacterium]